MNTGTPLTGFSTWTYKVLFPVFWFGLWGVLSIWGDVKYDPNLGPALSAAIGFLCVVGLGGMSLWIAWRLKTVTLLHDHLEVGGMFEQARVPLREVTEIRVIRWYTLGGGNPVSVRLSRPPPFLESMAFLPESDEALDALMTAWQRARAESHPAQSRLPLTGGADGQGKRITGADVWLFKLLFPLIWFGVWVPILILAGDKMFKPGGFLDPGTGKALVWTAVVGLGALAAYMSRRLKSVRLVHDHIEIGGLFERVRVPLREVTGIEVLDWYTFNEVRPWRITFANPTPFLESMLLLPQSTALLDELKAAWKEARDTAPAPSVSEQALASLRAAFHPRPRVRLRAGLPRRSSGAGDDDDEPH